MVFEKYWENQLHSDLCLVFVADKVDVASLNAVAAKLGPNARELVRVHLLMNWGTSVHACAACAMRLVA